MPGDSRHYSSHLELSQAAGWWIWILTLIELERWCMMRESIEGRNNNILIQVKLAASVLEGTVCQLVLQVVVDLEFAVANLWVTLNVKVELCLLISDGNLGQPVGAGSLGQELHAAAALHGGVQKGGLINGASNRQQTMVPQNAALALGTQCLSDQLTLLGTQNDTAVAVVDAVRFAKELAGVLGQHLQPASKDRPGLAVDAVVVAHGMNVGASLVYGSVDQEASSVGRLAAVAADHLTVEVDENHVAGLEQTKMLAERVRPEGVVVLGIPDGDVAAHALDVVLAVPVAESGCHVFELPLALGGEVGELGDTGESDIAVGHGLQRRLVGELMAVLGVRHLFGDDGGGAGLDGLGVTDNGRRSHGGSCDRCAGLRSMKQNGLDAENEHSVSQAVVL